MLPALWPHSRAGRPPLDSHCSQYPRPVFFLNLCRAKVDPPAPHSWDSHHKTLPTLCLYDWPITLTHNSHTHRTDQMSNDGIKFRGSVVPSWSGPVNIDNIISALLALTHNAGSAQGSAMQRNCNPSQYCSEKCCLSDYQEELHLFPVWIFDINIDAISWAISLLRVYTCR